MATIEDWAASTPDAAAIISAAGRRTFSELDGNANRLARALRSRGLVAGDAVALVCGNRPEFVEVLYGCRRAGFRLTPVNWHLNAEEVAYIVSDCEAKALVADASVESVSGAWAQASGCTIGVSIGGAIDGFELYSDALAGEEAAPLADPALGGTMLYTSGTTGRPKGVYRPPAEAGSLNIGGYDESGGDSHLTTGPLYHAAPLAFSLQIPLSQGASAVLMERWDAEDALALIDEHRVTHTHMVPTMFHRLLSLPEQVRGKYDSSSLRYVLHGAAPCPVPVKRRMIEWLGPIIWEYYAATEGLGSFVDSATWLERPGTVGRPFGPDQVIIGDEDGNPLPADETGLVYLKAPGAARFSYFKDDEKTRSTFRGDYFTLGDVGHLDEDGFLFLTDRSANLIISGGVNIYPAEVDAVLLEHPAIADAATIGLPDEEWGETVVAVVELQEGWASGPDLAEELRDHCRGHLAHFKCPRRIEFVDQLPRQDNGKIYKRLLRDQLRAT